MAGFIGYPNRQVMAVFDDAAAAARAIAALREAGGAGGGTGAHGDRAVETFAGEADAERFDATGERHGVIARLRRAMQFSLMDQLPAMAWYEAALREGKSVVSVRTTTRARRSRSSRCSRRRAATSSIASGGSTPRSSRAGAARSRSCRT